MIAAPAAARSRYRHDGLDVYRYAVSTEVDDVEELYGRGSPGAAAAFASVLSEVNPTIVHFHSFTRATSLLTLEECRRRGIPAVLTYHTPTVSCIRGTLLRWGKEVCDGQLDSRRCAQCVLQSKGLPQALSVIVGAVPPGISRRLRVGRTGQLSTLLGMRYLVSQRLAATRTFLRGLDAIVAPCEWARDLLLGNGVEGDKLSSSRHGLRYQGPESSPAATARTGPIKFAFVGRAHPTKGLSVLLEAFRLSPDLHGELTAFLAADRNDRDVGRLLAAARRDARIKLRDPIWDRAILLGELAQHDCLLVPSLALETGPLVVLEARAVGLPTVGSRLGGMLELIRDGVDGLLVEPGNAKAWGTCLQRLAAEPALLASLRRSVQKPRTMVLVAAEMAALYHRLAV